MTKSTIVFSCDENFVPFARGLVLSLKQFGLPNQTLDINFIDVGCEAASLDWFRSQGIRVTGFDYRDHYAFDSDVKVERYHQSLLCRPIIPQMMPGYNVYLFIDSDIWIQESFVMEYFIGLAEKYQEKIIISPNVDSSYVAAYGRTMDFVNGVYRVFANAYSAEVAKEYAVRPIFNCGLFAMSSACPLWGQWKAELDVVFNRNYPGYDKHGVEQAAMNYLIYKTGQFIPLDGTFNYHCHEGYVRRDASSGKVIIGFPPNRIVGAIHLTATTHMLAKYMEWGLLFDQGRYLTEAERQALKKLNHYF
jgi:hypothetical protein